MLKEVFTISLVQYDIVWENPEANLGKLNLLLKSIGNSDLIVLPEMFISGFSMNPGKLFEEMDGPTIHWMKQNAASKNAVITGSLIIKENNKIYNRCLWVSPDGNIKTYDKRHLYTMGDEHNHYTAGNEKLVVEYLGWKICPLICYDLRFPVWSRNQENYDLLIYMANWPAARHHVWKNLLTGRAIENQSYCTGVNRTGNDGMGLQYHGDSTMVDPKGYATYLGDKEQTKTFQISYSELHTFRKKFPLLNDRDSFYVDM
jgi:predicted amidohydrolase